MEYDVVVWIDEDGDVVCTGKTPVGHRFLSTISPAYDEGDIMEIVCSPTEFQKHVPPDVQVGMQLRPSKNIVPMDKFPLH